MLSVKMQAYSSKTHLVLEAVRTGCPPYEESKAHHKHVALVGDEHLSSDASAHEKRTCVGVYVKVEDDEALDGLEARAMCP